MTGLSTRVPIGLENHEMNKISISIGIILSLFLIAACSPQVSDQQLQAELEQMPNEELEALAEPPGALAGQPTAVEYKPIQIGSYEVERSRAARLARQVLERRS